MAEGYAPTPVKARLILAIFELYRQQDYMYDSKVHSVKHQIVSITQPWIRPIVRGKPRIPVEFGTKFDMSLGKRCYGMGLIVTKLEETQLTFVALFVFVMNLFKIHHRVLSVLFYLYNLFSVQLSRLSLKMFLTSRH